MINQTDLDAFGYYDVQYEMNFAEDQTPLDMVKEFRVTMGQGRNQSRSFTLLNEEWTEFLHAASDVEELKELTDLIYVAYGYAEAVGWDIDEAIRRVHKNNLERCTQEDGTVKYREDGKVLKRENAPKVVLEDLL